MKLKNSQTVYQGKFLTVTKDCFLQGDKEIFYELVKKKSAITVLPITKDQKVVFVKQERAADGIFESLELPSGHIDDGETPKQAAIRELKEETGCVSHSLQFLGNAYTSNGFSNEQAFLFVATDVEETFEQELDEDEEIEIVKIPLEEVYESLSKINHLATLTTLLYYHYAQNK